MYYTDNVIHLKLGELLCICDIVSLFDDKTASRIDDIYSYHKNILKESINNPLCITIQEINNFKNKVHFKTVLQPEFIFSEDIDIY